MTTTLPWRYARDTAEQQPAAALRPFEVVRAGLRGEPAGDLAHRRQQGQPAVVRLDRLVRHGRDAAVDERPRERLVGGNVQVGEEDEALAQAAVLGRDRLLHLQQQLRTLPDLVDRADPGAVRLVVGVRELAAGSGTGLDDDFVAVLDELARPGGGQRDSILLGLDLLGDADAHWPRNLSVRNVRAGRGEAPRAWWRPSAPTPCLELRQRPADDLDVLSLVRFGLALLQPVRDEQGDELVDEAR